MPDILKTLIEVGFTIFLIIAFIWGCSQSSCNNFLLEPVEGWIVSTVTSFLMSLLFLAAIIVVAALGYIIAEHVGSWYPYDAWKAVALSVGIPFLIAFIMPLFATIPQLSSGAFVFMLGAVTYFIWGQSHN